jgi:CheY-like chemotaxis protein
MTRDLIELMRVRATDRHLQLALDGDSVFPCFVSCDGKMLRQSLINLIGNAIRYTEQGGVTLRLSTQPADSASAFDAAPLRLIAEVSDSGPGIAPEYQGRIFEPFVQVDPSNFQKGTGLGLAITRKYVELMGGRISLQSTLGQGACFRIDIPVTAVAAGAAPDSAPARRRVLGLAPGQPACRILIVEDQPENWMLLQRILEPAGFVVQVAQNGQLGVEAFQAWQPHFIWMDMRMPVLDGMAATRQIRVLAGGSAVKIVALTASVFDQERDQVMAAGMDGFVRKPFLPHEIFDTLTNQLGLRFIYDEEPPPAAPVDTTLHTARLGVLPLDLRGDLRTALLTLDTLQISEHSARIAALDPALGAALAYHITQLDFTAILHALDVAEGASNAEANA